MSTPEDPDLSQPSGDEGPVKGRGCLTGVGVLFLGAAGLAGLAVLSQVMLGFLLANQQSIPGSPMLSPSMVAMNIGLYTALAVGAAWLGVGLLRARRWARAVAVSGAWLALIAGLASLAMLPMTMSMMQDVMAATAAGGATAPPNLPANWNQIMMVLMVVVSLVFYVAVPGAIVLALSGRNVRRAVQVLDPRPSWTDGVPIPVLMIVVFLALMAISLLTWPMAFGIAPLFGTYVTGGAAYAVAGVIGMVAVLVALGLVRLDLRAWWATLVFIAVMSISFAQTLARSGIEPLYERMFEGMADEMIQAMHAMYAQLTEPMIYGLMGSSTFALLYMLGIRRHFRGSSRPPADT